MRPATALLGFVLGSSVAICFGLFGVAIIFWVLGPEYPELAAEVGPLLQHLLRFIVLAAIAGLSFFGMVLDKPWRRAAIAALAAAIAVIAVSYSGFGPG
jgi:hypothetical protein